MRTAARAKSGKNGSRKKFVVESTEAGLERISGTAAGDGARKFEMQPGRIPPMPGEQLRQAIAEAAYYRAEKRNFIPGFELEDWLSAEAEVAKRLSTIGMPEGSQGDAGPKQRRRP